MDALFPVLPVDILASRGVDRRGEKWEVMEFKVGQLFICPLSICFLWMPSLQFPSLPFPYPSTVPLTPHNPVIFSFLLSTILLPSHPSSSLEVAD